MSSAAQQIDGLKNELQQAKERIRVLEHQIKDAKKLEQRESAVSMTKEINEGDHEPFFDVENEENKDPHEAAIPAASIAAQL